MELSNTSIKKLLIFFLFGKTKTKNLNKTFFKVFTPSRTFLNFIATKKT